MTISHHPSAEIIADYASGSLDEGRRLVLATHLRLCAACRDLYNTFDVVGGALLESVVPAAMKPDALARAMARLDDTPSAPVRSPSLSDYALGRWLWRGPGVYWRAVPTRDETETRTFMLRVAPNTQLPHHTHEGFEWTCILQGAFRHQGGVYGPGDFDEADDSVDHTPVVEPGADCTCLVAMRGTIQLKGWQRLLQPLIRI
jgi:putative transcriptional regulator